MMRAVLAAAFCIATGASNVHAQDSTGDHAPSAGKYSFFLEPSAISIGALYKRTIHAPAYYEAWKGNDFDNLMFEAFVATHIFIHNGLTVSNVEIGTGRGWSKVWTFTPFFRLRQLGGFSSPLRSASFSPRLSLQLMNVRRYGPGWTKGDWGGGLRIWQTQFILQHHSNGGPGCLFLEDHRSAEDQCVSDIPAPQRTVDTAGSFSTDFAEVRGSLLKGEVSDNGIFLHSWSATVGAEFHSRWLVLLPGYISREQQSVYGPYRLKFSAEMQRVAFKNFKWESGATTQYIFYEHKPSPGASPITFEAETGLVSDDTKHVWRGWGARLRYYQGQDYYNLFFFRDIRRLYFEIVIDPMSQNLRR